MSSKKYTIIVSGEELTFIREQIQSEPESWFATFFFGSFAEAAQGVREIKTEKDIHLFKLIQAYLRGYVVLPPADAATPLYMTKETALINLQRKTRYYVLKQFEEEIENFQRDITTGPLSTTTKPPQAVSTKKYKFANFTGGEWVVNDTTPEGYQIIMSRIEKHPEKAPNITRTLSCSGYTQVICWMDLPCEGQAAQLCWHRMTLKDMIAR